MKRVRNLVIGGIQNKIFNLILFTVLLLMSVYSGLSLYQSHTLSELSAESQRQQQEAIGEISDSVMDSVIRETLERSNRTEAQIADEMFRAAGDRVEFMADYAAMLLADPEDFPLQSYAGPDPAHDGVRTAKVIYAQGVDPTDPEIVSRVGLLSNLSQILVTLCPSSGAANAYIALPEGVHISVSDTDSSWFVDGEMRSYDPRQRGWYLQAAQAGTLVFTDGEYDANTGAYCVECACPVYGPEGRLAAVVGTDLYLSQMQAAMQKSVVEGEYRLLINQSGHAVLAPQAEVFPMTAEDRTGDLRASQIPLLAQIVSDAVNGGSTELLCGELADGEYYLTAAPIPSTGWALISAYRQEIAGQPAQLLRSSTAQIQEQAVAQYQTRMRRSGTTTIVLLLVVTLLTLVGAVVLGKRIVKPLNTITQRIAHLREGDLEFKMEDAYRTGDEVEELASSFAAISHRTVEYLETVKRITAEKERIGAELSLATKIQAAMLPHIFPPFPGRSEIDLYASMDPAKEVGGDFYDFFLVDDDHLGMVIADVSGKGVPAALFMMASKIILQSCAMLGQSPAEILAKTNQAICSNNQEEMFITAWVGILELSTGRLVAANAGHEYPVLKQPGGGFALVKDKHGFVLGGMEGVRYKDYELQLEPGAKLFLYTDGVPEATDADHAMFGAERMLAALNEAQDKTPEQILRSVRQAVDGFVQEAEQFDDLTMLCLHYIGTRKGGGLMKELTLDATLENIAAVTDFVNAELEAMDCPIKAQMQIDVAIDELMSNIARYAYDPETGPATVRVEVEQEPLAVLITFIDHGKPYDPLATREPDVTASADARQVGGLGVFLVKKTMDDVSYEYKDGQNILRIRKNM